MRSYTSINLQTNGFIRQLRLPPVFAVVAISVAIVAAGCGKPPANKQAPATASALLTRARTVFSALPAKMPGSENDTPAIVALGEKIYMEEGLSANRTQSCNTCHRVDGNRAGVDNEATSLGALGKRGTRNTQTVFNAGFQFLQFWDGRAKDLAEQAKGPILNPLEMAMPNGKAVEVRLTELGYTEMFRKAFPGQQSPVTFDNFAKAVAAFERTLISRSRFDDYMNGKEAVLTEAEKAGLQEFMDQGCTVCHADSTFGGQMFQKMGLVHEFTNTTDLGRMGETKNPADKMIFKVPMLRDAALTAPYYHNGSVATLDEAVSQMAWLQLGKKLTEEQTQSIVTFIGSLSGEGLKPVIQVEVVR